MRDTLYRRAMDHHRRVLIAWAMQQARGNRAAPAPTRPLVHAACATDEVPF